MDMWPMLAMLGFVALGTLHFWWRARHRRLELEFERFKRESAVRAERDELTLAEARSQQHAVFNSMVEGLILLDQAGRIRLVNLALEKLFGLNGDIRGRTVLEAFRLQPLHELVERARLQGQVLNYELELGGVDNRFLQVNASAFPDQQGRPVGMILVVHDLTLLKHLESTRKEFVANVSHELRTPLSMIKGYVETLLDGAKDDPQVAGRFLQTIRKHSDRLNYLIEDLLTISRLESGRTALNLERLDLRHLVTEVCEDLAARANEKSMILDNDVADGVEARADSERIQQVLFNLIDNAIKYGRPQGRIRIAARRLDDQEMWEVAVADDGPGVPPEALNRIFERFYRVDRGRSREQGGTGLGLAIVKHIVQSHGGEVRAESRPGEGATFRFTLPASGRADS
jgi:two-component system, OmpR family, phosphate regulon sensor histidine kinase PhoR